MNGVRDEETFSPVSLFRLFSSYFSLFLIHGHLNKEFSWPFFFEWMKIYFFFFGREENENAHRKWLAFRRDTRLGRLFISRGKIWLRLNPFLVGAQFPLLLIIQRPKKNEKILSLKNAESNERRWRPGHWLRSLTSWRNKMNFPLSKVHSSRWPSSPVEHLTLYLRVKTKLKRKWPWPVTSFGNFVEIWIFEDNNIMPEIFA